MANGYTFPNLTPSKGVLYTNQKKLKDAHPDFQGAIMLADGTVVKISGWTKHTPKGKLISLAEDNYVPKSQANLENNSYPREVTPEPDENDIPF